MSTLVEKPDGFAVEEWLRISCEPIPEQGNHVVVVSGYAQYFSALKGSDDDDHTDVEYLLWIDCGPRWREVNDVSPTAFGAGYIHAEQQLQLDRLTGRCPRYPAGAKPTYDTLATKA